MSQIRLTRNQFDEVKSMQEEGSTSAEIAKILEVKLPAVNVAFRFEDFTDYEEEFGGEPEPEIVKAGTSGQFRSLVASAPDEIGSAGELIGFYIEKLNLLRKSITFLERREDELRRAIKEMEKTVWTGIVVIEKMEESNTRKMLAAKS